MILTEMKIQHITRQNLAAWINQLFEILNEASMSDEDTKWVVAHYLSLQTLAENGAKEFDAWKNVRCLCGRLLIPRPYVYNIYLNSDTFTIGCQCGMSWQFKYQIVEEPIEVPF